MSRRPLIIAVFLMCCSLGSTISPAQAIPLQHFSGDRSHTEVLTWAPGLKIASAGKPFPLSGLLAPTRTEVRSGRGSDPCGFSQGWLAQQKNGVVICGSLADFYAPKISAYPATRAADISGGPGLALLLLGLGILGLATRRPVWIRHLMR